MQPVVQQIQIEIRWSLSARAHVREPVRESLSARVPPKGGQAALRRYTEVVRLRVALVAKSKAARGPGGPCAGTSLRRNESCLRMVYDKLIPWQVKFAHESPSEPL